jgi:hypothetical protein
MPPGSGETVDHFPSTHATWIVSQLASLSSTDTTDAAQAAQELRTHIMARYREPLLAYATASSFRFLGTPEDLVHGFFADRVARPDYLREWRGSGARLRRWLCNGLLLHMFDVAKRARREQRLQQELAQFAKVGAGGTAPDRAFDRAWAEGILERAAQTTERQLNDRGRTDAWIIFRRTVIDGERVIKVRTDLGLSEGEAKARVQLATRHFREAVSAELMSEGLPPSQVAMEAESIVAVFQSRR